MPEDPAICLMCGRLVCAGSGCCKKEEKGELTRHLRKCGDGVGTGTGVGHWGGVAGGGGGGWGGWGGWGGGGGGCECFSCCFFKSRP